MTVPEDAAELLAELRRHGVQPGQRLHIIQTPGVAASPAVQQRRLSFIGSVHGGPADVSERTEDYLRGFGQE